MEIKTDELTGKSLCYVVCMIEMPHLVWGKTIGIHEHSDQIVIPELPEPLCYSPFTGWDQIEPIIDREGISIIRADDDYGTDADGFCNNVRIPVWGAIKGQQSTTTFTEHQSHEAMYQLPESEMTYGPTRQTAVLRCLVKTKMGDVVEIPNELMYEPQTEQPSTSPRP